MCPILAYGPDPRGSAKGVCRTSLHPYGKQPFATNHNGRLPTTVMVTGEDERDSRTNNDHGRATAIFV